jgi:hypothetical protein
VYHIIVCSRTKIRMISSLRNFRVRILDADRFTIVVFQILDIKYNYLPGIVQLPLFCEGCVVCGANFALSVMMWFYVPPSVVLICFAPSEVKLYFAPSEVHHFLPFQRGESQLSIFVVWHP